MLKIGLLEAVRTELKGTANFGESEMKGFLETFYIFVIRSSSSWVLRWNNFYHSP